MRIPAAHPLILYQNHTTLVSTCHAIPYAIFSCLMMLPSYTLIASYVLFRCNAALDCLFLLFSDIS
jgi:hypothetical protein